MKTVGTSETSVNVYETKRCNIPEDCDLQSEGRRGQVKNSP
jgi:hypothetical protein